MLTRNEPASAFISRYPAKNRVNETKSSTACVCRFSWGKLLIMNHESGSGVCLPRTSVFYHIQNLRLRQVLQKPAFGLFNQRFITRYNYDFYLATHVCLKNVSCMLIKVAPKKVPDEDSIKFIAGNYLQQNRSLLFCKPFFVHCGFSHQIFFRIMIYVSF